MGIPLLFIELISTELPAARVFISYTAAIAQYAPFNPRSFNIQKPRIHNTPL